MATSSLILPLLFSGVLIGFQGGDVDKLQGRWEFVSVESGGVVTRVGEGELKLARVALVIEGEKYFVEVRSDGVLEKTEPSPFRLNESRSPKEIDLVHPDEPGSKRKEDRDIYRIDGDTLTQCHRVDGERPEDFNTYRGSRNMVFVLKRAKNAK